MSYNHGHSLVAEGSLSLSFTQIDLVAAAFKICRAGPQASFVACDFLMMLPTLCALLLTMCLGMRGLEQTSEGNDGKMEQDSSKSANVPSSHGFSSAGFAF
jgi:hypothetical protein